MTPAPGEVWLADRGDESRRLVFVLSVAKFQRLAERVVVAPVIRAPDVRPPWNIPIGEHVVAIERMGTLPVERLLDRVEVADVGVLRVVRRALHTITT